jgi:hypothetical protein
MGTQTLDDMAGSDIIDTRDIIERSSELDVAHEDERDDDGCLVCGAPWLEDGSEPLCEDCTSEWAELRELIGDFSSSWHDGEPLVRDSHFEEYARELAEDIGAISSDAQWPLGSIDWKDAATELRMDYTSVDIRGYTYYGRA